MSDSIKNKDVEMLEALKEKKFIDANMARHIRDRIFEAFPNLKGRLNKYDINSEDMIRFQLVSGKCRAERDR